LKKKNGEKRNGLVEYSNLRLVMQQNITEWFDTKI